MSDTSDRRKSQEDKNKIFNTSFPLDAYKNSNVSEDLETPLTEDEKKKMIKQCLKDCENHLEKQSSVRFVAANP